MKYLLLVLSVLVFVVSCNPYSKEDITLKSKLNELDKIVYDDSQNILYNLKNIDTSNMSEGNKAYYYLLYSTAVNESYGTFNNDSIISYPLKWYENKKEWNNYCRSSLYKGIALFNINKSNPDAYFYIKQSESLYKNHKLNNKILASKIYLYLGKLNCAKQNYNNSEKYLLISRDISVELKRIKDEQNVRLDLFWTYLAQKKYKDALKNIIGFEESANLSPEIQYNLYNALAGYYSAKKEFNISAEYTKKIIRLTEKESIIIDKPKLYYTLSSYYKRSGKSDSSLLYSQLAVRAIDDSLSTENHFYYKYLADINVLRGNYIDAYENYKKAYKYYILAYSNIALHRELEIEKKFNASFLEDQLSTNKRYKNFLLVLSIVLFCFSTTGIIFFTQRFFYYRKRVLSAENQIIIDEQELKKCKLLNELMLIPAELLVEFTDDVYNQNCKNRKISPELFEKINKSIDNIKSKTKNKYSIIANDERLFKDNPNLKYISELSDMEKLILILKDYGYSSQDIAKFLCSSPPRIRAVNAKLKEKISSKESSHFSSK